MESSLERWLPIDLWLDAYEAAREATCSPAVLLEYERQSSSKDFA